MLISSYCAETEIPLNTITLSLLSDVEVNVNKYIVRLAGGMEGYGNKAKALSASLNKY